MGLTGERRRWCYDSGDWNWPEKGDANCIAQGQYNRTRAGISVAIAMSIVIPFLICGACLILRLREIGFRRSATKQQQQQTFPPASATATAATTFNEEQPIT